MKKSLKRLLAFALAVVLLVTCGGIPGTDAKWTIQSAAQSDGEVYPAYFYTLLPGMLESDMAGATLDTSVWNAMGVGGLKNAPGMDLHDPAVYTRGTIIPKENYEVIAPEQDSYLPIWFNNKLYTYDPTGTKEDTYSVIWTRVIVSYGVNYLVIGDQGKKVVHPDLEAVNKSFNGTKPPTFHMDGVAVIHDENFCNVKYWVMEAGEAEYTLEAGHTGVVTKGTKESNLKVPSMTAKKKVDGLEYVFDGWYDESGNKVDFAGDGVINADKNYYGRYVLNNEVTITASSANKVYDGTALTDANVSWSGLPEGYTVTATMSADSTITNVGEAVNKIAENGYVIKNAAGKDVTAVFKNVTTESGKLTVTKRSVTLTSPTESRVYNGSPLTNDKIMVGGDGFAEGEGASYDVTGSQTLIGSSENTFSYTLNAGTLAENYEISTANGTLTVTDRNADDLLKLTVEAKSDIVKYDGEEKKVEGLVNDSYTVNGESFTVEGLTASAAGTDAGAYEVVINGTPVIKDAKGNDVTAQFTVEKKNGTLTVEKRVVTLTSADDEKVYDGNALTNDQVIVGGDGFATGEGASYDVTGSQTLVGSSENTFIYTLNAGTDANNYEITAVNGTLNVKNRDAADLFKITVAAKDATVKYDGTEQSVAGIQEDTFVVNGLTYTVEGLSAECKATDAGNYDVVVSGTAVVRDAAGNDVTAQFAVEKKNGTLTIEKRVITLTSADAGKTYDGTALTNTDVAVSGDGFAAGEGAIYDVTGSQTEAGSSENTFTYTLNSNTKAENYDITTVNGTLTVSAADAVVVTITEKSGSYTYDGTAKTVSGYEVTSSNALYGADDFSFSGTATVSGTDAGTYEMELKVSDFVNTNSNFTNVSFVIVDGSLTITPVENVTVTILGDSNAVIYDGSEKSVQGYEVTINNALYTENDFTFSGDAFVSATDAGSYVMGLEEADFVNTNSNFVNVTFTVVDGQLDIAKRAVTITAASATKSYDGQPLTEETVSYDVNALAQGDSVEATVAGSQTDVGASANKVSSYAIKNGSRDVTANYDVTLVDGTLTVTKADAVVVTITEKSGSYTYDGTAKIVSGYEITDISNSIYKEEDIIFSGNATVSGTDAGTYEMELEASDFANTNSNFGSVSFVIVDGSLIIAPVENVAVTIVGDGNAVIYDGSEKSVQGYEVTINNTLYTENDFIFSGNAFVSATNAGSYAMGLEEADFVNTNSNFANVTFTVVDGQLDIAKRAVTMTSASASKNYDGAALTKAEVTAVGFAAGEGATYDVTGSQTEVGSSENSFTYILNGNTKAENYAITTVKGTLTVSAADAVVVTITEKSGNYTYDGTAKTVSGYEVTSSNALYGADDFRFSGTATVSGTDAGTYEMELEASDFVNTNSNFTNVSFVIVDGSLTIAPVENVTVTILGDSKAVTYDGSEKSVQGYEVTINNALYTENDFTFGGDALVSATDAGSYAMGLKEADFANTNSNFANVTFTVVDGQLDIAKRAVTMTSASASKNYDGAALTKAEVTAVGFAAGEGATYDVTGSQTEVGSSENSFTYTLNGNTKAENYDITTVNGTLTVSAADAVVVTITEKSGSYTYDGTVKTVSGYEITSSNALYGADDFRFSGTATVSGTDAGTYEMELKASDFVNTNSNFTNVSFVIVDGSLTITPVENVTVTILGDSKAVTYDGSEKSVQGYEVTINNALYTENDFTFCGDAFVSATDAGSYAMDLEEADFVNTNSNFVNVTFTVVDGQLDIAKRAVTITAASATKSYDGQPLTEETVTYDVNTMAQGDSVEATVAGSQTDVGVSANKVSGYAIKNGSKDVTKNYDVTLVDGSLTVTKADAVVVTITEKSGSYTYDGTAKTVSGYEITDISNTLYNQSDIIFNGTAAVTGTDAGTYEMELEASDFVNTNANFDVSFVIVDGQMEISKRTVTLASASSSKIYNGTALTNSAVAIGGDGFANGEGATYSVTGTQTEVGISENTFTYTFNDGTNADNYDIVTVFGTLEVKPVPTYMLTIHYVNASGDPVADDYAAEIELGASFSVTSPAIAGYTPDYASISSDESGMPAQNLEFTVVYTANPPVVVPNPTPVDPTPVDPTPVDPTPVNPTPVRPTPVDPTPARPTPVDPMPADPTPVDPDPTPVVPEEDIPEDEPTDAVVFIDENGNAQLVPIGDKEIPLANMQLGDHYCNIMSFLLLLAACVILIAYTKQMKKHQEEIFELKAKLEENQWKNRG